MRSPNRHTPHRHSHGGRSAEGGRALTHVQQRLGHGGANEAGDKADGSELEGLVEEGCGALRWRVPLAPAVRLKHVLRQLLHQRQLLALAWKQGSDVEGRGARVGEQELGHDTHDHVRKDCVELLNKGGPALGVLGEDLCSEPNALVGGKLEKKVRISEDALSQARRRTDDVAPKRRVEDLLEPHHGVRVNEALQNCGAHIGWESHFFRQESSFGRKLENLRRNRRRRRRRQNVQPVQFLDGPLHRLQVLFWGRGRMHGL
mmetsp:Transcript_26901/g.46346  ORF Transcript_26901/g.46346 Transcript_26901/m.46346 type:complete len:260 (-) Transcript_26901:394-1173(-)